MSLLESKNIDQYSFIRFRNMLNEAVEKWGYTEIAKKSGVARSTLYRIIDGEIVDMKLSTAHQIKTAIITLKIKKSS